MTFRTAQHIVVFVLALVAVGAGAAWADKSPKKDPHDGDLPASVRKIERETGGEVLKAQPMQRDGREVYRVKVLTPQGRIRVVEETPPRRDPPPDKPPSRDHLPE
jgi:2-methylcitrate dehydratase PrpD